MVNTKLNNLSCKIKPRNNVFLFLIWPEFIEGNFFGRKKKIGTCSCRLELVACVWNLVKIAKKKDCFFIPCCWENATKLQILWPSHNTFFGDLQHLGFGFVIIKKFGPVSFAGFSHCDVMLFFCFFNRSERSCAKSKILFHHVLLGAWKVVDFFE